MGGGGEEPTNLWGDPLDRPHVVEGPCLQRTSVSFLCGAGAGTFYGSALQAWYPDQISSYRGRDFIVKTDYPTLMRRIMRPAVWWAAAGATFSAVDCMMESARNKRDPWNAVAGGAAAGMVMGAYTKRFDYMTVLALAMGVIMGGLTYSGPDSTCEPEKTMKRNYGVMPKTHVESEELAALKEKYPKFKDL